MIQLSSLDPLIADKSLLKHPFYIKWSKGELTMDDMKVYAKEYYHLVRAVPGMVASIAERLEDQELKHQVWHNALEETEHIALWERFAKACGVTVEELRNHQPTAKAIEAVAALVQEAEKGTEEGIAAMYALEAELPQIAQTKKEGLQEFYGLTSEDAQVYFDEHLNEEMHLQVWRQFSLRDDAAASAEVSLDAQNRLLDAVCDAAGIDCQCM